MRDKLGERLKDVSRRAAEITESPGFRGLRPIKRNNPFLKVFHLISLSEIKPLSVLCDSSAAGEIKNVSRRAAEITEKDRLIGPISY